MESFDNTPNILKSTLFIVNWNECLELELVGLFPGCQESLLQRGHLASFAQSVYMTDIRLTDSGHHDFNSAHLIYSMLPKIMSYYNKCKIFETYAQCM